MVFEVSSVVATTRTTVGGLIQRSTFHMFFACHCVDESTPTVLCPNQSCFPPHLQGFTRPKLLVPATPFDPLSSFTATVIGRLGFRHTPCGKKEESPGAKSRHTRYCTAMRHYRHTTTKTSCSSMVFLFNNHPRRRRLQPHV